MTVFLCFEPVDELLNPIERRGRLAWKIRLAAEVLELGQRVVNFHIGVVTGPRPAPALDAQFLPVISAALEEFQFVPSGGRCGLLALQAGGVFELLQGQRLGRFWGQAQPRHGRRHRVGGDRARCRKRLEQRTRGRVIER